MVSVKVTKSYAKISFKTLIKALLERYAADVNITTQGINSVRSLNTDGKMLISIQLNVSVTHNTGNLKLLIVNVIPFLCNLSVRQPYQDVTAHRNTKYKH